MNNKGYTLIELIAVIVIIAIVSSIVVLNFDHILGRSNTKKDSSFQKELEKAACVYIDLNENKTMKDNCYPSSCSVTAQQLINKGMISDELIDPTTDNKVSGSLTISVSWNSEGTKSCTLNR